MLTNEIQVISEAQQIELAKKKAAKLEQEIGSTNFVNRRGFIILGQKLGSHLGIKYKLGLFRTFKWEPSENLFDAPQFVAFCPYKHYCTDLIVYATIDPEEDKSSIVADVRLLPDTNFKRGGFVPIPIGTTIDEQLAIKEAEVKKDIESIPKLINKHVELLKRLDRFKQNHPELFLIEKIK